MVNFPEIQILNVKSFYFKNLVSKSSAARKRQNGNVSKKSSHKISGFLYEKNKEVTDFCISNSTT